MRLVGFILNDFLKFFIGVFFWFVKRRIKIMLRYIYIYLYGSGINSGYYSVELWGVKCWMRLVLREVY